MSTVKCAECGAADSVVICSETGAPLCDACSVTCQVCHAPISRKRVNLTSRGRKLCGRCMAERNARREAQREQLRREAAARKRPESAEAPPPQKPAGEPEKTREAARPSEPKAEPASTSFEDLMADEPEGSTSFSSLAAGEPDLYEEAVPEELEPGREEGEEGDEGAYGLEGAVQEGSKRLELGPIDEKRPVLSASGYQAPSLQRKFALYIVLGLAGVFFLVWYPALRDAMFPWAEEAGEPGPQFDRFTRDAVFYVAWGIVGLYALGGLALGVTFLRRVLNKRRVKRMEREEAESRGYSLPG